MINIVYLVHELTFIHIHHHERNILANSDVCAIRRGCEVSCFISYSLKQHQNLICSMKWSPEVVRQDTQHYPLIKHQTTTTGKINKEDEMEMDAPYAQETSRNPHPLSHHMEHPREEAKSKAVEHLAETHEKRNKEDGIHQETDGEDGHKQSTVVFFYRWPMLPANKVSIRHK